MTPDTVFEISAPDVVAEDFGNEIVVLNLANGKYFSLTDTSADIWRDIVNGLNPDALVNHLQALKSIHTEAAGCFIGKLISEQLIRQASSPRPLMALENATSITALEKATEPPKLEIFDDMAELILSDPVHDVEEEKGWPVKRTPPVA